MKTPQPSAQTLAAPEKDSLLPIPQRRATDRNPSHWGTLDKTLHLLIQWEESLLGDALTQCHKLLEESRLQVEEIQQFLNDDE
jgi:hypothetical protein